MADIKALTTKIVAAYMQSNTLAVTDISDLIQATYAALVGTTSPELAPIEHQLPAVPVKKSVTADAIICLECGKHQKTLKRHIGTAHGLSVDEYRAKWSLAADYPMVAPNYAAHRSQLAVKIGLGRKKPADDAHEGSVEPTGKRPYNYPASRWSKPSE